MKKSQITVGIVYQRQRPPSRRVDGGMAVERYINAEPPSGPWHGFGRNHNLLMEKASSDWYVALNPDVRAEPAQIFRIVDAAETAGFAICSPILLTPWGLSGLPQADLPGASVWLRETFRGARGYSQPEAAVMPSAWVSGACIAIRLDSGLRFDEKYFMYFEDADLCRRAWLAGLKVGVVTTEQVSHQSGWNWSDPLLMHRGVQFARSAIIFAQRRDRSQLAMRTAGFIRALSRTCLPQRTESERAATTALLHGFRHMHTADGIEELAELHNAQAL